MDNVSKSKQHDKVRLTSVNNEQNFKSGLYIREDDRDWGSAGMNDIQNQSDIS